MHYLEICYGDCKFEDNVSQWILTHYSPVLLFYISWKHQKTFRFSDIFRGYKNTTPSCNGLIATIQFIKNNIEVYT